MNQKQRKAKLKRANQHRTMAKCPEYQSKWSERQDKWADQMKEKGRLVDAEESGLEQAKAAISFFAQEQQRIEREKWIELIKECVSAILAVVCFVLMLSGIYLLVRWID